MKIFISGGCKNGKSTYAEKIAKLLSEDSKPLYYVATMLPMDNEDDERIKRHQESRKDLNFETIEIDSDIGNLTTICNVQGTFLLDSTTALLVNEMFLENGDINLEAHQKITSELLHLFDTCTHLVIVSDYIYSDAFVYDEYTEGYRKSLAFIDKACAKTCDIVLEACLGRLIVHKGQELFGGMYEKII